jgi:hypothetical protein
MNITVQSGDENVIFVTCSDAPHKNNSGEMPVPEEDESNEGGIFHA